MLFVWRVIITAWSACPACPACPDRPSRPACPAPHTRPADDCHAEIRRIEDFKSGGICLKLLLSNTASFVVYAFRRVKDHHKLLHCSPRVNKACVEQVVLDKVFPLVETNFWGTPHIHLSDLDRNWVNGKVNLSTWIWREFNVQGHSGKLVYNGVIRGLDLTGL